MSASTSVVPDNPLDERDDLVPVDAAVRQSQPCRARHPEEPADLRLRGGARVAAGAKPHVGRRVELDRLRRDALAEDDTEQLGGRENVAQRLVGAFERDATALADRLEAMVVGERLEQPERLERAGRRVGGVLDPDALERVLEHRQVEPDVVRDEHRVAEAAPGARPRCRRTRRRSATSSCGDPVHGGRLCRNLPRRPDEPRVPPRLDPVRVELNQRE